MNAIKSGRLKALRDNKGWKIDPEELDKFINSRGDTNSDTVSSNLHEIELRHKDELLAQKDQMIEQLKSEIEHLRKPFWKRW